MEKDRIKHKLAIRTLLLCLCVSIICGGVSGWYFGGKSEEREMVVLDVAKIIETKKKEFVEKYRDREPNSKMKEEMDREISSFVDRLNKVIEEESQGKVVLVKDSVISNARDITDEVSKRIKSSD